MESSVGAEVMREQIAFAAESLEEPAAMAIIVPGVLALLRSKDEEPNASSNKDDFGLRMEAKGERSGPEVRKEGGTRPETGEAEKSSVVSLHVRFGCTSQKEISSTLG